MRKADEFVAKRYQADKKSLLDLYDKSPGDILVQLELIELVVNFKKFEEFSDFPKELWDKVYEMVDDYKKDGKIIITAPHLGSTDYSTMMQRFLKVLEEIKKDAK